MPTPDNDIIQAARHLRSATSIAVLTGAGISAESGIPTFRDALTGWWSKYNVADLATPQAFARDPERVTRWYDERRCIIAQCRPNPGHLALATLQQAVVKQGKQFTLITQNVDRLHRAAGSTNVIELHGTLWVWRCVDCDKEAEECGPAFPSFPPHCPCGGLRRPDIVWFGENLPADAMDAAERAMASCDFFYVHRHQRRSLPRCRIDWSGHSRRGQRAGNKSKPNAFLRTGNVVGSGEEWGSASPAGGWDWRSWLSVSLTDSDAIY